MLACYLEEAKEAPRPRAKLRRAPDLAGAVCGSASLRSSRLQPGPAGKRRSTARRTTARTSPGMCHTTTHISSTF
eukprot:8730286-Pyramimonas_sp.AAC.1